LSKRGSLTLFISEELLKDRSSPVDKKRPLLSSLIRTSFFVLSQSGLTAVFLTVRAQVFYGITSTHGQGACRFRIIQCCAATKSLPVEISHQLCRRENSVVGMDSTGLKVYGEGEWKVRRHGRIRRRTWRKLHVCVDLTTQEILTVALTGNCEDDIAAGSRMLQGYAHRIKSFKGYGTYDRFGFREVSGGDVQQVIPLLKNAAVRQSEKEAPLPAHLIQRNEAVRYIQQNGLPKWKEVQGCHQRSLNETVMFRYKTIFGGELKARMVANQTAEVELKCFLLNTFREIGMPDSYKMA
jgi:hypothetical protein